MDTIPNDIFNMDTKMSEVFQINKRSQAKPATTIYCIICCKIESIWTFDNLIFLANYTLLRSSRTCKNLGDVLQKLTQLKTLALPEFEKKRQLPKTIGDIVSNAGILYEYMSMNTFSLQECECQCFVNNC